jgi:hypothetical protein
VRDVAASAAKHVIGSALVPIEAANRLLQLLVTQFGHTSEFKLIVGDRLVGYFGTRAANLKAWEPAEAQLARALEFDDSLFMVEEQNLFIDEVRESKRWVQVFETLEWQADDEILSRLAAWVVGGTEQLGKLAQQEDGPLGWASIPTVFAICTRIIRCAVVLGKKTNRPGLEEAVALTKEGIRSNKTRVSKLLTEDWNRCLDASSHEEPARQRETTGYPCVQ